MSQNQQFFLDSQNLLQPFVLYYTNPSIYPTLDLSEFDLSEFFSVTLTLDLAERFPIYPSFRGSEVEIS